MSSKVLVIGAQNIDIFTSTKETYTLRDSNLCDITITFGGVGRNIATNLKRLGVDVSFLTVFGNDHFAEIAVNSLQKLQINTTHSLHLEGSNSIYMGILQEDNDLFLGLNDMKIVKELTPSFLEGVLDYINQFEYVVIDNNLTQQSIEFITKHAKGIKIMDAVSAKKLPKLLNSIPYIDYLKVNEIEYNVLKEYLKHSNYSIKNLIITSGKEDITLINETHTTIKPLEIKKIINASGAGDGFLSGFVYGLIHHASNSELLDYGRKVAYITMLSKEACNKDLSLKGVNELESIYRVK